MRKLGLVFVMSLVLTGFLLVPTGYKIAGAKDPGPSIVIQIAGAKDPGPSIAPSHLYI